MNRTVALIALALMVVVVAVAWPQWRLYQSDPARYKQLMGTDVDMGEAVLFAETHTDFSYAESPLARYLRYERRFVEFDDAAVLALGDRIATEVGWKMLIAAKSNDIQEAEALLWTWGEEGTNGPAGPGSLPNLQARAIMEWIAEALILENLYYGEETLFSVSFDGHKATGREGDRRGDGHIDCDQLAHIFLHVAWRLDLDVREVLSPLHIYLSYVGPAAVPGLPVIVEATQFRGTGEPGDPLNSPFAVGANFFMHPDQLEKYGHIRATRNLKEAAGYYTFATDRDIEDAIVSEVMVGIGDQRGLLTLDAPVEAETAKRWADLELVVGELEAHLEGTRKVNLVSNLYQTHWQAFRWSLTLGELERAEGHVARLEQLRQDRDSLIVTGEPLERIARARLQQRRGDPARARAELRALWEEYGGERTRQQVAQSDGHAEILVGLYELGGSGGAGPRNRIDRFERYLSPVLGFEKETRTDDRRRKAMAAECGEVLRTVDRRSAEWCAAL